MPFPPIRWCLVCEDIRIENRRLVSLLGFYGIAPDVEILFADFNRPVDRLAFYISAHGASDGQHHRVSFELRDPHGAVVLGPVHTAPTGDPPPAPATIRVAFIFTATAVALPREGVYQIVIRVDGGEHFTSNFTVRQGRPEEFE